MKENGPTPIGIGRNTTTPTGDRPPARRRIASILAFASLGLVRGTTLSAAPVDLSVTGGWQAVFEPASASLECRDPATQTTLKGRLSVHLEQKGQRADWSIQPPRDFASHRLAVVDPSDDVHGYITVTGAAGQFSLNILAGDSMSGTGELCYEPEVHFGDGAYACRTRAPADGAVVQMASGPADSGLNDSLFDPGLDRVLRLGGKGVTIVTQAPKPGAPPAFHLRLTAGSANSATEGMTVELITDYYRGRWVPNYHPIDRRRCPSPPTGWMAWNTYFDQATEADVLNEAQIGARLLKPFGLQIWSVESWQENSPDLPVSNFHNLTLRPDPGKFPHGMKWMQEQIRALGFRPGIWTVPWGTGDESYYQAHRAWFLHKPDGTPYHNWCGRFLLDPSQPEVRKQMEESYRLMANEWGYEFFKVDGMSFSARSFARPDFQAAFQIKGGDPYSRCLEAIRRGIGPDSLFLACAGNYTNAEVAWADATRTGGDVVLNHQPPTWDRGYRNQALMTLRKLFTHNIVWYNDPDTLLVGEFAPLNVARIATTVVALPGQVTFFGDKLGALPAARVRLLQQCLPVCAVRPLDLAPIDNFKAIWDLKISRSFATWDVVSLFNWENNPRELKVAFAELGLNAEKEYLVYEFWSQKFLGVRRGDFAASLEPRSNVLLAIHEQLNRPQLLSTDRHVTQGGVELRDESWDATRGELQCRFNLVANDPLTAFIYLPPAYRLASAFAHDASVRTIADSTGPIIAVVLKRESSGENELVLHFEPLAVRR